MDDSLTTDPSACASPDGAPPPTLTAVAGAQTERPVWLHADGVLDLNAIVARVRSRPAVAPRSTVTGYYQSPPFGDIDTPYENGIAEHAVRVNRGWSDALDAGVSW